MQKAEALKAPHGSLSFLSTHWKFPVTLCHSMCIKPLGHHTARVPVAWDIFDLDKEKRAELEAFAWSASTKCS